MMRRYSRFPLLRVSIDATALAAGIISIAVVTAHLLGWLEVLIQVGLAFSAFIGSLMVIERLRAQRESLRSPELRVHLIYVALLFCVTLSVIASGLVILMFLGLRSAALVVQTGLEWVLYAAPSKDITMMITASATAVAGLVFFWFRLRLRFLYGLSEAFAGVVVAVHRVSLEPSEGLPNESGFYFAVLTAGVYLVVRGLDNMHQGVKCGDPVVSNVTSLMTALRLRYSRPIPTHADQDRQT